MCSLHIWLYSGGCCLSVLLKSGCAPSVPGQIVPFPMGKLVDIVRNRISVSSAFPWGRFRMSTALTEHQGRFGFSSGATKGRRVDDSSAARRSCLDLKIPLGPHPSLSFPFLPGQQSPGLARGISTNCREMNSGHVCICSELLSHVPQT